MERQGIEISRADKVFFPDAGITKGDVVDYYDRISERMLPFLKGRPLTLHRFPDGVDEDGFYQKSASDHFPDFVARTTVKTDDGSIEQVVCNSKKTLVYLADQGTVGFHIWLSKVDQIQQPDRVVFDLDPPEGSFEEVKKAAKDLRDLLKTKGQTALLMTTGKKGLHVYFEKKPDTDFDRVREHARDIAEELCDDHPEAYTTETRKDQREGRVFIDYLRNAYGQTTVCPFSLRPRPQASVASPIDWDELDRLDNGDHYDLSNIFKRLAQKDG